MHTKHWLSLGRILERPASRILCASTIVTFLATMVSPAAGQPCSGDCDGDGQVTVAELISGVNIALGLLPLAECPIFDRDDSGMVEIDEIIRAIGFALHSCPVTSTPTATASRLPDTPTASPTPGSGTSGLLVIDRVDVPNDVGGTPHLFDLLVGDRLYLANSFGAAVAYDVSDDGLSLAFLSDAALLARCTSLALHAASRRLYCAAVDLPTVAVLNADTGDLVSQPNLQSGWGRGYRDLHVVGDILYLAAFDAGLLRAPIHPDGSLGDLEPVLDGEVVGVAGDAARLAVLDRAQGLRVLEEGREVGAVALDGPPLRLAVHDGVAAVALGSRGAVVIDLATRTTLVEAHPPCVAVDADYHDGALAIACTTGLYLYQTQPTLRTAGWDPAVYASLGARFVGDLLVANDWRRLTAYRVNLAGRAVGLDAPRGFLLEHGQSMRFAVRNPDDQEQHLAGRVLPPHGELTIEVPQSSTDQRIELATDEQDPTTAVHVTIARDKPRASFGSPFPIALTSRYVSFIQPDCALQFPAIEDLTWLTSHGEPPSGLGPLVLLVPSNDQDPWPIGGFLRLWGEPLEAMRIVEAVPGAASSIEAFDALIGVNEYIPGADTTVEFVVDEGGRIAGFDRVYRGAYPLAASTW